MPSKPMTCDELEALEKVATPGPWGINKYCSIGTGEYYIFGGTVVSCDGFGSDATGNAPEFICALRNEAPRLLAIRRAAEVLLNRLDAVHNDPRYESVWQMYWIHGGVYTEPTYTAELDDLRAALAGEVTP